MKLHDSTAHRLVLSAFAVFLLTSCEDKALVRKNEDLRKQVSELEEQVGLLEMEIGEDPGDQTALISEANSALKKALEQLEQLDNEKMDLEASHEKLEKEFRDYQKKYPINE
ncbi:MAG: hypothetical protein H7A51_03560 [Akkermansiaceae bacterium]|nr:hypothetical protein [Akkermansiaceae bacterium]